MNILETFYDQIDWEGQGCYNEEPGLFIKDMSRATARKHSYAMQVMDDCLTIEPRYTPQDLLAEKLFLESVKNNKTPTSLDHSTNRMLHSNLLLSGGKGKRPGEVLPFINYPKASKFTARTLKRYNEICLKMKSSSVSLADVKFFKEFDRLLMEERAEYQQFARKQWNSQNYLRHGNILPGVKKYIDEIWQARLNKLIQYPQFYKQISMVPLVYNKGADSESNEIDMVPGRVLDKQGKPGRFVFIPYNKSTYLPTNYGDLKQEYPPDFSWKYPPVSRDPVAERLVQMTEAQVVISSSGLKCLLDNQSVNVAASWSLPICIKEYKKEKGTKKVVFIDKKLPPRSMTCSERVHWYSKIATRLRYCQRNSDVAYDNCHEIEPSETSKDADLFGSWESINTLDSDNEMDVGSFRGDDQGYTRKNEQEDRNPCSDDAHDLVIAMDCDETDNFSKLEESGKKLKSKDNYYKGEESGPKRIQSEIKSKLSSSMDEGVPNKSFCSNGNGKGSSNKYCYVYQMWRLGKQNINQMMKTEGEIVSVMIRSRRDCIQETYKKKRSEEFKEWKSRFGDSEVEVNSENDSENVVVLVPKLEYQFELGAEKVTKSECIRQWVDSVIRPSSELKRVRINPLTGEVIQIERSDQQRIKTDGLSMSMNLSKSWCSLYSVISKLVSLSPGNYVLEQSPKNGAFCALFGAVDKPGVGSINLYTNYHVSVDEVAPIQAPWIPLDENVATPMCRYKSILPVMFPLSTTYYKNKPIKMIGELTKKSKKNRKRKKRGQRNLGKNQNNQRNNDNQGTKPGEENNAKKNECSEFSKCKSSLGELKFVAAS